MTVNGRDRGATLPIVALLLPVLILMTAFAVDLGRQRSSRRTMQARADVIALDLVRLTDERTLLQIKNGDATHDSADAAKAASAARNNIPLPQVTLVEWGTFTAASGFIPSNLDASIPNAVRVTTEETTEYFFQPGGGGVKRTAIATTGDEPTAGFSMGSFGVAIDPTQAGLLNALITPLLGNPVGINALSYQGLATATLGIYDLGTELGLVTPDEVLNTAVAFDDVLLAAAAVLERNGDTANANILEGMITSETQLMGPITLGQLVSAGPDGGNAAMAATVDALGIVKTGVFLSQCTDPGNLATCSGIAIPSLTTSLPLLSTTGSLNVIQAPVSAYGPVGTDAETSQVGLTFGSVIGAQQVGTCTVSLIPLQTCLLSGLLVGTVDAQVTIDATLQLAQGIGEITDIGCGDPLTLDVGTRTGLYAVDMTVRVDFGSRGILGGLLGTLLGSLELQASTNQIDVVDTAHFDIPPDVYDTTVEQTGAGSVGLSTLNFSVVGSTGVLTSLATLGISYTVGSVVTAFVNPLLTALDTQILSPIADTLGVNVTGADITPLSPGIKCNDTLLKLVG
jgi:uncharacterized membrane protein